MAASPCAILGLALALESITCHHRRVGSSSPRVPFPASSTRPQHGPTAAAPPKIVQGEEGLASWYGHPYHGRRAASGEIYNMNDMTAAHRTLPFGTQVKVHNLDSDADVQVRINDRGPFVEDRIIDLSYAAAKALRMVGPGMARVRLEILNPDVVSGPAAPPGLFSVQVGAFKEGANAERLQERISAQFGPVFIQSFDRGDGLFHRVRVGQESSEDAARELAQKLRDAGFATETFVVRIN